MQTVPGSMFPGLNNITAPTLISAGIIMFLVVAVVVLVFFLISGGIAVISSGGGDPQKASQGKSAMTGAIVGLLLLFGAWAVIGLVSRFFGINIIQLNIPSLQ